MTNEECLFLNSVADGHRPSEFTETHHVHIIVRRGEMSFSDGRNRFVSRRDDLVIWQMYNTIQQVEYTSDFEADFLIVTPAVLAAFNPEMVWASKGFVFIRLNPSFHLDGDSLRLMNADFELFRTRLLSTDSLFRREVAGNIMRIFLYDLWSVYQHGLSQMDAPDHTARLFLRFLALVADNVLHEREVGFYADCLCITAKYLSQVSRAISGLPASQWIQFYATFELIALLNDTTKTLSDISDEMGFSTLSFFSRYVKKVLGKTPSKYRQK